MDEPKTILHINNHLSTYLMNLTKSTPQTSTTAMTGCGLEEEDKSGESESEEQQEEELMYLEDYLHRKKKDKFSSDSFFLSHWLNILLDLAKKGFHEEIKNYIIVKSKAWLKEEACGQLFLEKHIFPLCNEMSLYESIVDAELQSIHHKLQLKIKLLNYESKLHGVSTKEWGWGNGDDNQKHHTSSIVNETSVNNILDIEWGKSKKLLIKSSILRLKKHVNYILENLIEGLSIHNNIDSFLSIEEEQKKRRRRKKYFNDCKDEEEKTVILLKLLHTYYHGRKTVFHPAKDEERIQDLRKSLQIEFSFFLVYFTTAVVLIYKNINKKKFLSKNTNNNNNHKEHTNYDFYLEHTGDRNGHLVFVLQETLLSTLQEENQFLSSLDKENKKKTNKKEEKESNYIDNCRYHNDTKGMRIRNQLSMRPIEAISNGNHTESSGYNDFTYNNLGTLADLSKSFMFTLQNLSNQGKLLHFYNVLQLHEFHMKDYRQKNFASGSSFLPSFSGFGSNSSFSLSSQNSSIPLIHPAVVEFDSHIEATIGRLMEIREKLEPFLYRQVPEENTLNTSKQLNNKNYSSSIAENTNMDSAANQQSSLFKKLPSLNQDEYYYEDESVLNECTSSINTKPEQNSNDNGSNDNNFGKNVCHVYEFVGNESSYRQELLSPLIKSDGTPATALSTDPIINELQEFFSNHNIVPICETRRTAKAESGCDVISKANKEEACKRETTKESSCHAQKEPTESILYNNKRSSVFNDMKEEKDISNMHPSFAKSQISFNHKIDSKNDFLDELKEIFENTNFIKPN